MNFVKSAMLGTCLLLSAPCSGAAYYAQDIPTSAPTIDKEKLQAASKLVETIMPAADREKMMQNMLTPMMNNITAGIMQDPEFQKLLDEDPQVKIIFEKFIERQKTITLTKLNTELPGMATAISAAYARQFSLQEMSDATSFFSTPSGKAYMIKANGIMADEDVAKWQRNLMSKVMADKPAEMKLLMDDLAPYVNKTSQSNGKK